MPCYWNSGHLVIDDAAIESRSGMCRNDLVANAQAVLAKPRVLNFLPAIVSIDAAAIADIRVSSHHSSVENDHAEFQRSCAPNSHMRGMDEAASDFSRCLWDNDNAA